MQTDKTSVFIVGGSLVGLSAAMFLGLKGVKTILVGSVAFTIII